MTDTQAALAHVREALAAGPTPGPWVTMPANAGVHCVARINAWEAVPPSDCELSHDSIDASFIAACSPANMTAILAHVKAQEAEIDRLTRERDELSDEVELKSACINGMSQATDKLAGERDEARADRDEFAMDAKRYAVLTGWLARHGLLQRIPEATRPDGTFGVTWVLHPPKVIDGSRLEGWSATTAACAIDSALAQIEQEKANGSR